MSLLPAFSQLVWQFTHDETDAAFTFPSWEAAFKALADLPGRPIVIIDEITYLIAGNKAVPSILQKVWDAQLSRSNILHPQGTLYNEPLLLLVEELREPRNYFSILRAIAAGHTRLNEIAQAAGVGDSSVTARYIDILQRLRVVRRLTPVTERQPEKSKKGIYQIEDAFLHFWFRFVHPYRGSLELGLTDAVFSQRVQPVFDAFAGHALEEAAQAYVTRLARNGQLPFLPERVGRWWRHDEEIDWWRSATPTRRCSSANASGAASRLG